VRGDSDAWQKVVLTDSAMAQQAATRLLAQFGTAYRKAGVPPGVSVYRERNTTEVVYYFSPKACAIAEELLCACDAMRCPHTPNVHELHLIPV
jgi:hypothetical protein